MRQDELVELAGCIARRIAHRALWQDEACTWTVRAVERKTGGGREEAAGGGIYQGSAGIALFLGEAYRATGEGGLAAAAAGGLAHALAWAAQQPAWNFSFHAGRIGTAWVAHRLATLLERPELRRRAAALLDPMRGREPHDGGLDVIAGAAGSIPALLSLADGLGRDEPLAMARGLGERLLASAHRGPHGWSWGTVGPSAVRNLTGFAHGASGIALALLELSRATGDGRFRFAAEMAFLYERELFDAEVGNWPDLRHRELSRLHHRGGDAAVREAALAGAIPAFEPNYMNAWCHGAPGVGLARVRAFELTAAERYRQEARAAVASTLPGVTVPPAGTFCLCHGTAGNCELLIEAARVLAEPALTAVCHAAAEHGRASYEEAGRPWPCGAVDGANDPSLMLGEAGIGHFFLRLADDAVPSVLLVRPAAMRARREDGGFAALAASWIDDSFRHTRAAWLAQGEPWPPAPPLPAAGAETPLVRSPVEVVHRAVRARLHGPPFPGRDVLADAFTLDDARHQLVSRPHDLAAEYLRGLERPAEPDVDWDAVRVGRAEGLRRLATRRDWGREDAADDGEGAEWALLCRGGEARLHRLRPWSALVLDALEPPATLEEAVERVRAGVEGAAHLGRDGLRQPVADQLRELYRAEMVDLVPAPRRERMAS